MNPAGPGAREQPPSKVPPQVSPPPNPTHTHTAALGGLPPSPRAPARAGGGSGVMGGRRAPHPPRGGHRSPVWPPACPRHWGLGEGVGGEGIPVFPPPSHDGAAFCLLLLEGGGDELGAAGQVQESLGEASCGAFGGLRGGFAEADAGHGPEDAVDAFLRGEGRALQVALGSQLLGHGAALQPNAASGRKTPQKHPSHPIPAPPPDLLVGDGCLLLMGELHQRAQVRPQVCLAADEQHPRAGAVIQDLRLPLRGTELASVEGTPG